MDDDLSLPTDPTQEDPSCDFDTVRAAAQQSGAALGSHAVSRASNARLVAETIERIDTGQIRWATSTSEFLRQRGGEIKESGQLVASNGGPNGDWVRLKGHFIEALDIKTYNAKNRLVGKKLVQRARCTNAGYDASRFIKEKGKYKFAGAIQQKSSAWGTREAISQT